MKPEHIIQAIKETAKEYERLCERNSDAFVVVMALRGVVARAERYEAQEDSEEWQLPAPPVGGEWHRNDGWDQSDLPNGFRPLMAHEMDGKEHPDVEWKPDAKCDWMKVPGGWHAEGSGWFRTNRPY